jgi:hypothetical protein
MAQFFETVMGHKFYGADVPRALKALERIADALEKLEARPAPEQEMTSAASENEIEARSIASQLYAKDGEIEFDDDAKVSLSLDDEGNVQGAYVQAWVYAEFTANQKKEETR